MSLKNRLEPILIEGIHIQVNHSLRASSPVWASETGLARTRERAAKPRGAEERELATIPYKFSFVLRWKMTFRKSKLIENRLSWHPLRLCVKFDSQGDQIGTENLFQPSMQTGSFDVILAKRILRAEDKSDRVCSSRARMKTLYQLYSFVSSALFSSEYRESESEEWLKRCLPTSVSSPNWILLGRKIQKHVLVCSYVAWP